MKTRIEADSIGSLEVPSDAYYGVQSLRAKWNFPITGTPIHPVMIQNLAKIKKAAAISNREAQRLPEEKAAAIIYACDEIIAGKLKDQFIVDGIQGGAGTSANMNANEVIANRAIEILGGTKGDYTIVHPNDHVNMAQSTNDVIPSAGKLTVLDLLPDLLHALESLHAALLDKSQEFDHILKMGRTQLEDAVPMRLGQSFHAYATMIERDIRRIERARKELFTLNLGGTAIGTTINASDYYLHHIVPTLAAVTGYPLMQADDLFDATENLDGFVTISNTLKTCAVNLSKMCNDLRLLSSGPRTGFGEINLPPMQNGSSIMPGKINPVIPEVVTQVAFHVIGNDTTITMAAEAGQMELNAFEPVVFYSLFSSITSMTGAVNTLVKNCILGITANEKRCEDLVSKSVGITTALVYRIPESGLDCKEIAEDGRECYLSGSERRTADTETARRHSRSVRSDRTGTAGRRQSGWLNVTAAFLHNFLTIRKKASRISLLSGKPFSVVFFYIKLCLNSRYAALSCCLCNGCCHSIFYTRIKRCRQDIVCIQFLVAYQSCNCVSCCDLHFIVDVRCAHIERSAEDAREAQYVVHLVRIIASSCADNGCSCCFRLVRENLRRRICAGKDDRIFCHRTYHIGSERTRRRNANKNIGSFDYLCKRALLMVVVCDLRHLLFDRVKAVASLVNRTFAVCHDDVFETHRNQQADNGDSGCTGS